MLDPLLSGHSPVVSGAKPGKPFLDPSGIVVGADGRLFVVDQELNGIVVLMPSGRVQRILR
jgi:hypothetical protein